MRTYIWVLLLALTAGRGVAQETTEAPSAVVQGAETRATIQGPRLGDHLFSPIATTTLPFIRTMTTLNVGAGISSGLDLPLFKIGGQPVYASVGELAVVGFSARHEQAIKPWLSVYLEAQLLGRLGTSVTSLLGQGVNTVTGFDLGWKIRIHEDQRWSVITGLELQNGSYTTIDIQRWAEGVIDSGKVTSDNQLFDTKPALNVAWMVSAAHTFNRAMGLYATLTAGVEEPKVRNGEYALLLDALLAFSVDWNAIVELPVGTTLGVEYRENPTIADSEDGSYKNVYLRIGYTGDDAFGLGVQASYQYAPVASASGPVQFFGGTLDMRFYF